jgi:hypothetical protein
MATPDVLRREHQDSLSFSPLDLPKGANHKARGLAIEKKIQFLESMSGNISNRRTRRNLNDRILMELVPRLNAEEIRGLFAPPPWGDDVPLSTFSMANIEEWDKFRSIDMDKEIFAIESLKGSASTKKNVRGDADKTAVLTAWHRVDCRTREALRRSFLSELLNGYEECIRSYVKESEDGEDLVIVVADPFHRLLLHGVCEFYNLVSVTFMEQKGKEAVKATRIKKKKGGNSADLTKITLCTFLKMGKDGVW